MGKKEAVIGSELAVLDDMENLMIRLNASGHRHTVGGKGDKIDLYLSACQKPSEMAELAMKFGLTVEDLLREASSAPNIGQFRSTLGNRMRGAARHMVRARQSGIDITVEQAAHPTNKAVLPNQVASKGELEAGTETTAPTQAEIDVLAQELLG